MQESKRLEVLKGELIKNLPFFPNDKKTLDELKSQGLDGVMFHYLHWQSRQVPARPRRIFLAPEVTSDKRWKPLRKNINNLFDKVRNGESLYPHLSIKAHKNAYTPAERIRKSEVDSWVDKDQILNTKGFHHFHLDMCIQGTGLAKRTDEVLFAFVERNKFHAVSIFNHSVFDIADNNGKMNNERTRMWSIHKKYTTMGLKPGAVYIEHPIATSGHPLHLRRISDHYLDIIEHIDPKLDDRTYVDSLYNLSNLPHPDKFKFEWIIDSLDLILRDKKNDVVFNIKQGYL